MILDPAVGRAHDPQPLDPFKQIGKKPHDQSDHHDSQKFTIQTNSLQQLHMPNRRIWDD
ncbi:MAG: hypothetical protein HQL52_07040 [Magnetococcales bacterium]|nr:hypothetical protein [Magnetococcales bacterium]